MDLEEFLRHAGQTANAADFIEKRAAGAALIDHLKKNAPQKMRF